MSLKNKKNQNNVEIDLIEIFLILISYKWIIFLFIIFPILFTYLFFSNQPKNITSYIAKTEIKPISTFEEFEYQEYNNYLKNSDYENVFYSFNPVKDVVEDAAGQKTFVFKDIDSYNSIDNSSFKKIDKKYLLNLFIDKLKENKVLINAIRKFELLKREDYVNNQAYENAIMRLSNSIKIQHSLNQNNINNSENNNLVNFNIEFTTQKKEDWKKILEYIQNTTNKEIQDYLGKSFVRLIENQKRLTRYKLEDIDILILNAKEAGNKMYLKKLNAVRNDISKNRNIIRLKNEFNATPVVKSEQFYAAKLMIEGTSFKSLNNYKTNILPMLLVSGLVGGIIGIFFALIAHSIKNRSRN